MKRCKSCGAEIIWIKMKSGKSMPCNAEPVTYWEDAKGDETVITPNGETIRCRLQGDPQEATGMGYISHFATCPAANTFRRR